MARCARCGRKLTNPDAIAVGIGRECLSKHGKVGTSQAKWARRVMRTASIKYGNGFSLSKSTYNKDNFEKSKSYLQHYKWIINDGDVSDELLLEIYKDPSKFFNEEVIDKK